jgi:hypothetical protein
MDATGSRPCRPVAPVVARFEAWAGGKSNERRHSNMPRRIDSSSSITPLLQREESSSSRSINPVQPKLTRSMAGLNLRASSERSPGAQGMAPRGGLKKLGSVDKPEIQDRKVGFAPGTKRNEGDEDLNPPPKNFGANVHSRRPEVTSTGSSARRPSAGAANARPVATSKSSPSPPPSSPEPSSSKEKRGVFGKLFQVGGGKARKEDPNDAFQRQLTEFTASNADQKIKDYFANLVMSGVVGKFRTDLEQLADSVGDEKALALLYEMANTLDDLEKGGLPQVPIMYARKKTAGKPVPAAPPPRAAVPLAQLNTRLGATRNELNERAKRESTQTFNNGFTAFMQSNLSQRVKDHFFQLVQTENYKKFQVDLAKTPEILYDPETFHLGLSMTNAIRQMQGDYSGVRINFRK